MTGLTASEFRCAGILLALLGGVGCTQAPDRRVYEIELRAESDPGVPLGEALFVVDGDPAGRTNARGILRVRLESTQEGPVQVGVQCPDGHRQVQEDRVITLASVEPLVEGDGPTLLSSTFRCPPEKRRVAVVVRVRPETALPILMHGTELTRTDEAGIAHALLTMEPGSAFRLTIDTREVPLLRPVRPSRIFRVPDSDEVFVFEQSFERAKARSQPRTRADRTSRQVPIRIY